MRIPNFWAKETGTVSGPGGRAYRLAIWRWSDTSLAEAARLARDRLDEITARVRSGARLDRYGYGEQPLREEVVQMVAGSPATPEAVITRNGYGALVLNTDRVMFVDIDFDEGDQAAARPGLLSGLFGAKPASPEARRVQALEAWVQRQPGWGMRVYRTRAGLRCLVTHSLFDPRADSTRDLLKSLGADPLYIRLCRDQACFRARLTPKPWRCGLKPPLLSLRYPWDTPSAEHRFRQWQQRYEAVAPQFGVCRLVAEVGSRSVHPAAAAIVTLHDQWTCGPESRTLA